MSERVRSRLTYANGMATIAVFIALGAGAYAAGLAPNSVRSEQIVNGQVKSIDVDDHGLTGTDIRATTVAGTSRRLVYDFAAGGSPPAPERLATVRIGGEKWKFSGMCLASKAGFGPAILVNGPALSVHRSEALSFNNNNPAQTQVSYGETSNSGGTVASVGVSTPGHVNRSAGTALLSRGQKLMRVDFHAIADAGGPYTCSIRGTVTPAA